MIRLSLLTAPIEVDLTDVYPDLKIVVRRLQSDAMEEARDAAVDVLRRARDGLEALSAYGLDRADVQGEHLNPRDAADMVRAGRLVGAVEVAIRGLVTWEGVLDQNGAVAPITRETLSILLLDSYLQRRLLAEIDKASRVLVTEGNVSGSSPGGSSGTQQSTTAAQTTAGAVSQAARPARAASRAKRGATARKSPTPRKP